MQSKTFIFLSTLLFGALAAIGSELWYFQKKSSDFQKNILNELKQRQKQLTSLQLLCEKSFSISDLPAELRLVDPADESGIVLSTRMLTIPDVLAPYNPSIVEEGENYFLFFRYDIPVFNDDRTPFESHIGCVLLDNELKPTSPYSTIDTGSDSSEDPRITKFDGKYYLTFNDIKEKRRKKRGICSARFDPQTRTLSEIKKYDNFKLSVEKNWIPFSVDGKNLSFVYSMSPHKVYQTSPNSNKLEDSDSLFEYGTILSYKDWLQKWGYPRGGTPPRLVGNEYLSFFHSSITDDRGFVWYLAGAYTFETMAPYRITKISAQPILFKGAYSTAHLNTANPLVRCLYPSGFVIQEKDGEELIQLFCGENDSGIRIITLDKKALFKSLKPVDQEEIGHASVGFWHHLKIFK